MAALAAGSPQPDVTKSVQSELRRVGCLTGNADGTWNSSTQRSLTQFNRYAGTKVDTKVASVDTLDTIKLKSSRVCPLVCEHGFQAEGERCTKIVCAEGSFLNDDNECEKRRAKKPVAKRDTDDRWERRAREQTPALPNARHRQAPRVGWGGGIGPDHLRRGRLPAGQARLSRRLSGWLAPQWQRRQCGSLQLRAVAATPSLPPSHRLAARPAARSRSPQY